MERILRLLPVGSQLPVQRAWAAAEQELASTLRAVRADDWKAKKAAAVAFAAPVFREFGRQACVLQRTGHWQPAHTNKAVTECIRSLVTYLLYSKQLQGDSPGRTSETGLRHAIEQAEEWQQYLADLALCGATDQKLEIEPPDFWRDLRAQFLELHQDLLNSHGPDFHALRSDGSWILAGPEDARSAFEALAVRGSVGRGRPAETGLADWLELLRGRTPAFWKAMEGASCQRARVPKSRIVASGDQGAAETTYDIPRVEDRGDALVLVAGQVAPGSDVDVECVLCRPNDDGGIIELPFRASADLCQKFETDAFIHERQARTPRAIAPRLTYSVDELPREHSRWNSAADEAANQVEARGDTEALKVDQGPALPESADVRNEGGEPTFRRLGNLWKVQFGNEPVSTLSDRAGLEIIHRLIAAPGQWLSPEVLLDRRLERLVGDDTEGISGAGMPVLDENYRRELKERLEIIDESLQPGAQDIRPECRVALQEEKVKIQAVLRDARFRGRDRKVGSHASNAADAAAKSLKRAFDYLEQAGKKQLAEHLHDCIRRTHGRFSYNPSLAVNWRT